MDFTRLNNEFLNMQKKLEDNEICIKKLKIFIKSIDKEIIKLEAKRKNEKDVVQNAIYCSIIEIKKNYRKELEKILSIEVKE